MTVVLLRELEEGILVSELCCRIGFALSRDEGHVFIWRRDIGVQGWTVIDEELVITDADLVDGGILLTLTGTTFHWVEGRANLKGGNNENT